MLKSVAVDLVLYNSVVIALPLYLVCILELTLTGYFLSLLYGYYVMISVSGNSNTQRIFRYLVYIILT